MFYKDEIKQRPKGSGRLYKFGFIGVETFKYNDLIIRFETTKEQPQDPKNYANPQSCYIGKPGREFVYVGKRTLGIKELVEHYYTMCGE